MALTRFGICARGHRASLEAVAELTARELDTVAATYGLARDTAEGAVTLSSERVDELQGALVRLTVADLAGLREWVDEEDTTYGGAPVVYGSLDIARDGAFAQVLVSRDGQRSEVYRSPELDLPYLYGMLHEIQTAVPRATTDAAAPPETPRQADEPIL